jgi:hypothetical protein
MALAIGGVGWLTDSSKFDDGRIWLVFGGTGFIAGMVLFLFHDSLFASSRPQLYLPQEPERRD